MPIVKTVDLVKHYRQGRNVVRAVDGVNLEIERGEFLTIMGRSGSGKTTLLDLIGCLLRPTSGTILLDGLEVTALSDSKLPKVRQQKIGFVFQEFNLLPTLNALDNVMLPLRYSGGNKKEGKARALKLLDEVGLSDRAHHRSSQLSGGEQQRVAIARALINNPAIILGDEVTGEVDTETSQMIVALLRRLNQEHGQTFILVTHDSKVAEATDRIIHLKDGQIVRDERTTQASLFQAGGQPEA